jgi:hypothetical protein
MGFALWNDESPVGYDVHGIKSERCVGAIGTSWRTFAEAADKALDSFGSNKSINGHLRRSAPKGCFS